MMALQLHHLSGCAPAPLAYYLKALGVLRIVAQQIDSDVRGFWHNEHFCLLTRLDRTALERFFLEEYAPTAFVSPWNKGSGFYTAADPALSALERSTAKRFDGYRAGIAAARLPLEANLRADAEVRRLKDLTKKKKGMSSAELQRAASLKLDPNFKAQLAAAEREFKRLKADLYTPFALIWRGGHRDWMDAAMVLSDAGEPTWPSLLGTGGNDGRLDFTNNAMQRLGDLFDVAGTGGPRPRAASLLASALWNEPTDAMEEAAVGQYLPGTAGGANGTTGPDAAAHVNPWDFLLMLEGAVLFRGRATRRYDARSKARAAAPFAVQAHAVGHGTRGREKTERGEQWMPLWGQPATLHDLGALLGEGRAQLNRGIAQRPLDFARAIAKLGVARGLTGFMRYAYLERNGQSKIAVPLGRIAASERVHAALVDDLGSWLDRLQRLVRDGNAPDRLSVAEARLADAVFRVLTTAGDPRHWQAVLIAAARLEAVQASGTGFEAGPLPRLTPPWLHAANDESPEWRLAVALGSAAADYRPTPLDPVRAHVLPLANGRYATTAEKRLMNDPRVVVAGRDSLADLAAIAERRIVEASQTGKRELSLVACRGRGARLDDLAAFIDGDVDIERTLWLARGLMALAWRLAPACSPASTRRVPRIADGWMAIRLCGVSLPTVQGELRAPIDLAVIRRLTSDDAAGAVSIALRRLSAVGLRPPLRSAIADSASAMRWAAALAFPIERAAALSMLAHFRQPC